MVDALSGCNVANFHGGVYGELAFHPLQAILDDDIPGMIGRFIEGICVDRDSLALDVIQSVGPIPGDFLSTDHTLRHFRREMFEPRAVDLTLNQEWEQRGAKDCMDHARERFQHILNTHVPLALPAEQDRELERILEKARRFYRNK